MELVGVIDNIAKRQLLLKRYEAAQASYQRALSIWLGNKSYPEETIKRRSASIYHQLGMVAEEQRQWDQARGYFLIALETYMSFQDTHNLAIVVHSLARLQQASGDTTLPVAVAEILGSSPEEAEKLLRDMFPLPSNDPPAT